MKIKNLICAVMSIVLVCSSVSAVYATSEFANTKNSLETTNIEMISNVTEPLPFNFEVVSFNSNEVIARFVSSSRVSNYPYLGEAGTKIKAEKSSLAEYIIEYNKQYSFVYTCIENTLQVVYNATVMVNNDNGDINIIIKDVVKNIIPLDVNRAAGTKTEDGSNNTYNVADRTYDDYDNYGTINPATDVDWWVVSFLNSGHANFWLGNIPAGCDYDLELYSSDGTTILNSSFNAGNEAELITQPVVAGTNYYIKIYSYSGSSSTEYLFRTKVYRNIGSDEFGFYVYDADTLEPISGASVYAYRPKTYSAAYPVPTAQITNSSGEVYFSKTTLPFYDSSYTGGYGIIIKAPGYAQYTSPQYMFSGTERQNIALVSKNTYPNFNSPFESNEECTTPSMSANQHWGWRYLTDIDYHTGVDIGKGVGTKLYTVTDSGTVKVSANTTGAGNYVIIKSGSYYIAYLHMDTRTVSADQVFIERTQVGTVGNTGTTAYHLHISVGTEQTIAKNARSYLDPLAFIPFE